MPAHEFMPHERCRVCWQAKRTTHLLWLAVSHQVKIPLIVLHTFLRYYMILALYFTWHLA